MDRVQKIKRRQKIRNIKRKIKKTIMFMLVFSVFICEFEVGLAKYFYKDVSKETVVANTFYFSSDYLDEKDEQGIPPIYTIGGWDGKSTRGFGFTIRNYENPLLYNDSSQDVDYVITYKSDYSEDVNITLWRYLPDSPEAVNDYVLVSSGDIQTIEGGVSAYNHNDYKIVVEPKDSTVIIEKDVDFEIDATTINTQYIKQISAMVKVQYTEYTNYITSKGFIDVTEDSHALTYNICTANQQEQDDIVDAESLVATKTFCLHWDNEYLQINKFDNRLLDDEYIYIGASNDESANIYTEEYIKDNIDEFKNKIIINNLDGKNTGYLYFDTLPFSEFNIRFYKRTGNDDEIWKDISNMADVYIVEDL